MRPQYLAGLVLLAAGLSAVQAQTATPPTSGAAASGSTASSTSAPQTRTTAPLPSTIPKSQQHLAVRPPGANRVPALQRLSTAQRMATQADKPAPKTLPAVTASDATGHRVAARTTKAAQHWILLYREQNCPPCDRLMNALAASESPNLKKGLPYVILVAGAQPSSAEQVRSKYTLLSDATWLTDQDKQFVTQVKPRGVPALYAMEGDRVLWMAPGTEGNPARMEQLVSAWLADMAAKDAAPAKKTVMTATTPGAAQ